MGNIKTASHRRVGTQEPARAGSLPPSAAASVVRARWGWVTIPQSWTHFGPRQPAFSKAS